MEQIFQDINSTQLFRTLVFIFLKLAVFTILLRIVAAVVPQSSRVNCILGRIISLFFGGVFALWYTKTFMAIIQPEEESNRFLFFVGALIANIIIIRWMFPMPTQIDSKGGDSKDADKESEESGT